MRTFKAATKAVRGQWPRRRSSPALTASWAICAALLLRPPAAAAALAEGEVTLRQPVSAWVLVVGDESRA